MISIPESFYFRDQGVGTNLQKAKPLILKTMLLSLTKDRRNVYDKIQA